MRSGEALRGERKPKTVNDAEHSLIVKPLRAMLIQERQILLGGLRARTARPDQFGQLTALLNADDLLPRVAEHGRRARVVGGWGGHRVKKG